MSKADELAKLDALRQSGVLTQAEFEREKARVLGAASSTTRPAAVTVGNQSGEASEKGASWVVIAAGSLLIVSTFLPWSTVMALGGSLNRNGLQLGQNGSFSWDGLITLGFGLLILFNGIGRVAGFTVPGLLNTSPLVLGLVVTVGIVALDIPPIESYIHKVNALGISASIGYGIWVALVGGVMAIVAGFALRISATPNVSAHVPPFVPKGTRKRGVLSQSAFWTESPADRAMRGWAAQHEEDPPRPKRDWQQP
jgi:hypothetical protein